MHPSLPFPSSPCSGSSSLSPSSAEQDFPSPLTPDSYFSPIPAITSPDEFTFQIDVQLDTTAESPSITHLATPDEMSKLQVLLRNSGRWRNMYDRSESSPPLSPRSPLRDGASDDFLWEASHSALLGPDELADPSRCSLLIHEVSLLVGLTTDDDHLSPDDGCPLIPDPSVQVHDTLPLTLTPTKSLTSGKPRTIDTRVPIHSSDLPTPSSTIYSANHNQRLLPAGPTDLAMPIPRHTSADATRSYLSPHRRQGQVFHLEPPPSGVPRHSPVDLDETFCHPRRPPPKPTPNPPANRCSSLDRLECSLLKLEAHAPRNHRKSQSEGRSSDHVPQSKFTHPSLPPSRRLKQQQSSCEIIHRDPSHPPHGRRFSSPPPVPIPPHQYVAPLIYSTVPLDDGRSEGNPTPGSFMDMDIPNTEAPREERRTSLHHAKGKGKMKGLVSVAKRVSRGVIAWGKHLAGPTKPSVAAQVQAARV